MACIARGVGGRRACCPGDPEYPDDPGACCPGFRMVGTARDWSRNAAFANAPSACCASGTGSSPGRSDPDQANVDPLILHFFRKGSARD